MRRMLCLLLLLALLAGGALAQESPRPTMGDALSGMTLDELYALRKRVEERIAQLENPEKRDCYKNGTYRVGVDIPMGVYLLESDEVALLPSVLVRTIDAQTGEEADAGYEMVLSTAVMRLTVSGSFVTLSDVTAYPFEEAPRVGLDDAGRAGEGGYWVGEQIPAGTYRITPMEKAVLSSYSIYSDVLGAESVLLKFEVIKGEMEVTLEAGQYASLSGCELQSVP